MEALLLDVNIGKNQELMKSCPYLQEYATFVGKVKEYKEKYKHMLKEHGLLMPDK